MSTMWDNIVNIFREHSGTLSWDNIVNIFREHSGTLSWDNIVNVFREHSGILSSATQPQQSAGPYFAPG